MPLALALGSVRAWLRLRRVALSTGLTVLIAMATGPGLAAQRRPERMMRPAARAVAACASGQPAAEQPFTQPGLREGLERALSVAADEFFDVGRKRLDTVPPGRPPAGGWPSSLAASTASAS